MAYRRTIRRFRRRGPVRRFIRRISRPIRRFVRRLGRKL